MESFFRSEYLKAQKLHWYYDTQDYKIWMCKQGVNVYTTQLSPRKN